MISCIRCRGRIITHSGFWRSQKINRNTGYSLTAAVVTLVVGTSACGSGALESSAQDAPVLVRMVIETLSSRISGPLAIDARPEVISSTALHESAAAAGANATIRPLDDILICDESDRQQGCSLGGFVAHFDITELAILGDSASMVVVVSMLTKRRNQNGERIEIPSTEYYRITAVRKSGGWNLVRREVFASVN